MNIVETIRKDTESFQDRIAIVDGESRVSYAEMFRLVYKVGNELQDKGVLPTQRVALLCGDSIDYIVLSLAILSIDAVVVPVSVSLSKEEIDRLLARIKVNHLVFADDVYSAENAEPFFPNKIHEKRFSICRLETNDDRQDLHSYLT